MKTVTIVSGGMDSVTLAHTLHDQGDEQFMLSFDYGQRHSKELTFAARCADRLGVEWSLVDLTSITHLLKGSALTDPDVEVPHGHYAAETMKATVVPNRNSIMLNIAAGYAVSLGADRIATAVHAGDHDIYPDCRVVFIHLLQDTLRVANEGFIKPDFGIHTPFIQLSKADIAWLGDQRHVPWNETWSCYEGGQIHCGQCATCVERREAFMRAGVTDPTEYAVSLDATLAVGGIQQ